MNHNGQKNNIPNLSDISYLISDWDGMIIDSMPAKTDVFSAILNEHFSIPTSTLQNFYCSTAGMPLNYQIKEAARQFAHREINNALTLEAEFYKELEDARFEPFPGAIDFIIAVKKKGINLIIWSATTNELLTEQISALKLTPYIDFFIANDIGETTMTKGPLLFKKIAEHFAVDEDELAQKSLVIGDGRGDIVAGKTIGTRTAAFRFEDQEADFQFNEYSELLNALPNLV